MITETEIRMVLIAAGILLAANVLSMLLFVLFAKLPNGKLKGIIRNIIFELDKFADNMENTEKRRAAVQQVNEVLGWRQIFIPGALIGWIIDMEVTAIRKIQEVTDTPDLHTEGGDSSDKSNTDTTKTTSFRSQE